MGFIDSPEAKAIFTALEEAADDWRNLLPDSSAVAGLKGLIAEWNGGHDDNRRRPTGIFGYPIVWKD